MPNIEFESNEISEDDADIRLLVIGNSYYDNNGMLWRELRKNNDKNLYIETLTDDAATFESIIANNKGDFTSRQDSILEQIQKNFTTMGEVQYDADDLDGMGDYPIDMAMKFIKSRKGKLDEILDKNINWDYIIIQGFRGSEKPEEHNFIKSGTALIDKIKEKHSSQIFLMQNWSAELADTETQSVINENCAELANKNSIDIIPVGEKWDIEKQNGISIYKDKFTPNEDGIKIIIEEFKKITKEKI